jgi:hypothetical protein
MLKGAQLLHYCKGFPALNVWICVWVGGGGRELQ